MSKNSQDKKSNLALLDNTLNKGESTPQNTTRKTKTATSGGRAASGKPKISSNLSNKSESKKSDSTASEKKPQIQLRHQIYQKLSQIEQIEFAERKKEFYQKRSEIRDEINQILEGTHPLYQELVKELEEERDFQIKYADDMCKARIEIHKKEHDIITEQTTTDFQNERKNLINQLILNVEERKRKIKDERDCLEVTSDFILETTRGSSKRNLRNRGLDAILNNSFKNVSSNSALTSTGTSATVKRKQIQNFSMQGLADEDVISDLTELRKFTGVSGPIPTINNNKKNPKSNKR
ncbi:hypothetical protein AYI70_g3845 [Smittium culicis]|uniref:Sin3 histone deacetylase corepressor complex component SDS3 n=1 Tax=Smittium culicis TaxID=133412 RepID=A0A1R1Y1M1_9FUNG|nr:hypothetical protein AYI70_g4361 [Smittium culicis]OMJ20842.1 hypothetical protein AYI70_g3845 [Smittium culicis]